MKFITFPVACLSAFLLASPAAVAQETNPAMQEVLQPTQAVSAPSVSLYEAIKTALERSPSFAAAIDCAEAMRAATSKAGALSNPEISFEAENFAGSGPYSGTKSVELTYGLTQRVELTATLLTLVVLPALYKTFSSQRAA